MGFSNPADHPYEIIKYEMGVALAREQTFSKLKQDLPIGNEKASGVSASVPQTLAAPALTPVTVPLAKFRPWLQDFDMGATYDADMVRQEIKATQDALGDSFSGFMLWNPVNIYTKDAVESSNSAIQ